MAPSVIVYLCKRRPTSYPWGNVAKVDERPWHISHTPSHRRQIIHSLGVNVRASAGCTTDNPAIKPQIRHDPATPLLLLLDMGNTPLVGWILRGWGPYS